MTVVVALVRQSELTNLVLAPGGRLSTASMKRALLVKLAPDAVPKGGLAAMLAAGNAAATLGAWVAHERRDVKGRTPRKHVL
jgi:hypothetical protein